MNSDTNPSNAAVPADQDKPAPGSNRPRSRALLFTILSGLWIFPSLGACWILWSGSALWQTALTMEQRLDAMTLEQWCALGLLLAQLVFVGLAVHFRQTEQAKKTSSN